MCYTCINGSHIWCSNLIGTEIEVSRFKFYSFTLDTLDTLESFDKSFIED